MPTEALALIGAGGHARVVLDALLTGGRDRATIEVTACSVGTGEARKLSGLPVHEPEFADRIAGHSVHVAIGDNRTRLRLIEEATTRGHPLASAIHPRAVISWSAQVDPGCFVAALAVVGPDAKLAAGTIINHGALVDHDCSIGRATHIAPGAVLGGGVTVGDGALIGANATVLPGVVVGAGAIVGAGSVVTRDLAPGTISFGVPARPA